MVKVTDENTTNSTNQEQPKKLQTFNKLKEPYECHDPFVEDSTTASSPWPDLGVGMVTLDVVVVFFIVVFDHLIFFFLFFIVIVSVWLEMEETVLSSPPLRRRLCGRGSKKRPSPLRRGGKRGVRSAVGDYGGGRGRVAGLLRLGFGGGMWPCGWSMKLKSERLNEREEILNFLEKKKEDKIWNLNGGIKRD